MIGPTATPHLAPLPRSADLGHPDVAPDPVAAAGSTGVAGPVGADDVVVLLLADMLPGARLWGWSRVVRGAAPLRAVAGLRWGKALGSGHEGGFGLRPSFSRQGLFALFGSERSADDFIHRSATVAAYRERSADFVLAKLRATSCRGTWSGHGIAATAAAPADAPVAALTRASIRPSRALRFWRHAPASERALTAAAGCRLAVGLGEAPLLRQATFSVWDNQAAMDAYARSGAHLDALRGALAGGWLGETMFVRFVPLLLQGQWHGRRYG
jgi:spheroidene monooxygenase